MYTPTGSRIDSPTVELVVQQLERLNQAARGASITLCGKHHRMRVKSLPDLMPERGFFVLTYRDDYSVETVAFTPASAIIQTVTSFGSFSQAS